MSSSSSRDPLHNQTLMNGVAYVLLSLLAFGVAGCGGETSSGDSNAVSGQVAARTPDAAKKEGGHAEADHGSSKRPNEQDDHSQSGSGDEAHQEGASIRLGQEERERAGIKVQPLELAVISDRIVVTATIQPNQDRLAHVAPRVAGRVVAVSANLGDVVKRGQVLATLDSIELGEARSEYAKAQTAAELAAANFKRAEHLIADEIISQKEYLAAKSEHETARAALRAAEERLRLLGVSAGQGKSSVFPLTAPFAGTVIEKDAVLGELNTPDKSMFTIADLSVLWITANMTEQALGRVKVGARAEVTVRAYPDEVFAGRLTYISPTMQRETRTVPARIEVPNTQGRLKPEMFASASIMLSGQQPGLVVPDDAVVLIQGQLSVFIEEEGAFEARPVQLGDKLQDRLTVRSGIKEGDRVVVAGAYALKAQMLKSQLGEGHGH